MLENAMNWLEQAFQDWKSRVSLQEYNAILNCASPGTVWKRALDHLFWDGAAPCVASNRSSSFLVQMPFSAYSATYIFIEANPPDLPWDFRKIYADINEKGANGKLLMQHISLWFNPDMCEPASRKNFKPPMHLHLKPAFSKYGKNDLRYERDEEWKVGALEVQKVALDCMVRNYHGAIRRDSWMSNCLKFLPIAWEAMGGYEVRFHSSNMFWRKLIMEIKQNCDVPFNHPFVKAWNEGIVPIQPIKYPERLKTLQEGPYESPYRVAGVSTHDKPASPTERDDIDNQISSIIGQEYGINDFTDDDPELTEDDVNYQRSLSSVTPGPRSASILGKRKASVKDEPIEEDDMIDQIPTRDSSSTDGPRRSKIVKLKVSLSSSMPSDAPTPIVPDEEAASRRTKTGIRELDFFRNQIIGADSPARQEPSPATSVSSVAHPIREGASHGISPSAPTISSPNWMPIQASTATLARGLSAPIGPIPPPKRRARMHNLNPVEPSESSTPLPATPQLFASNPPISPPKTESSSLRTPMSNSPQQQVQQGSATPAPSQTLQQLPQPPQPSKAELAVQVIQDEYADKLPIKEMVAAINVVRNENDAGIFLMLKPGRLRNAWLYNEIKRG
jgi:hypothetical protein